MPNTLTTIFTSTPASEPVESPHPNTGVYTTGTQLGNGTWQVVHTLVTKTSTPPTITGRLKNFPAVAASVVASGNVLNNILATPTGLSAVSSSTTAINATVSSNPNATAYRLLSATTAGGAYAQIYQGAAAGFAHTGLTAGTTYYYEWQYVGSGYYDDSLPSASFSGATTTAAAGAGVTGYAATATSSSAIYVAHNGSSGASNYVYELATAPDFSTGKQTFSSLALSNSWTNLQAALQYYTRVKAQFSSNADSVYSLATASTFATSAPVTTAPTNFALATPTPSQNSLSWVLAAGPTVLLERATNGSFTTALRTLYAGSTSPYLDNDIPLGAGSYFYRLKSRTSGQQDSAYSYADAQPSAYRVSGASNFLSFANDADFNVTAPFTVGFFVLLENATTSLRIGRSTATTRTFDLNVAYDNSNGQFKLEAQLTDPAGNYCYGILDLPITLNTYVYLHFVWTGSTLQFYFNGALNNMGVTTSGTLAMTNAGTWSIGQWAGRLTTGAAQVDDFFFMNRAITAAEVTEQTNSGGYEKKALACSFAANVVDSYAFEGTLASSRGTHNASATTPQYVKPITHFTPALTPTPQGQKYEAFGHGRLIHFGMNTFQGEYLKSTAQHIAAPAASTFNLASLNWQPIIASAVASGCKYLGLTIWNEYGFALYPTTLAVNMPQQVRNGYQSPTFTTPYCVQAGTADQNIVSNFVTACRNAGIEPVAYVGFGGDLNSTGSLGEAFNQSYDAATVKAITDFYGARAVEVITKFGFKYIWADMASPGITTDQIQTWYDLMKTADPSVTLTINTPYDGTTFAHYPYDIQTREEYAILNGGDTSYQTTARVNNGITYQIPQEIVATPHTGGDWYYTDAQCPVQPTTSDGFQSVATFQSLADKAKAAGIPLFAGFRLDRTGTLRQEDVDFLSQIKFT